MKIRRLLLLLLLVSVVPASAQVIINGGSGGGGGGTVTNIATTSPILGGPITTTGTISLGNVPVANLNSGTGASATTFWRGDGTWNTPGTAPLSPTNQITVAYPNDTVTGTTVNRLVKVTGDPPTGTILSTSDTVGSGMGVCVSGCGNSGTATIAIMGFASCAFDGGTTALNYVIVSTTTAGMCHDGGSTFPTGVTVLGRVQSTNVGAGTYSITLFLNDVASATQGGGQGTRVTINGSSLQANAGNFNDTTPTAPTGATNVAWQKTNGNPSTISAYIPVANNRRVCSIRVGADNGVVLVNADLGPQGRECFIPAAATIVEVDVSADAGTPNVIVSRNRAGSVVNILSSALATAASGGIACSNTGGTTGLDGATTCSSTLQNTSLNAGDYLELLSGTAGGVAKRMSIFVIWTVN